jgi:signal transduction histidine kinase
MTERKAEASPRSLARMAGVFQLLEGMTTTFGQVIVPGRLVVFGNAAATAANILGHERLFWLGFASSLIGVVFHIVWALLLYDLFKPVNRRISLLAAFVILVGCAIQAVTTLLYLAPFFVLGGGSALSAFTVEQSQALALTFLKLNAYAFDIYLVFFGLWCVLIGLLIFRSTFLPRVLGLLLTIAGLGWMTYLSPPLASYLFLPYIAGASAVGEIPLLLWLLVVGVNDQRWKEQASAAGEWRS